MDVRFSESSLIVLFLDTCRWLRRLLGLVRHLLSAHFPLHRREPTSSLWCHVHVAPGSFLPALHAFVRWFTRPRDDVADAHRVGFEDDFVTERNVNHRRGEPSCEFVEKFARLAGKEGGTTRVTWHRYGSGGTGRWPLALGCKASLHCCCSCKRCAYGRRGSGISIDTAIHEERFYHSPEQKWPWNAWKMWWTGIFVL